MTDHNNLEKPEIKGSICLITNVDGYTLLVFKDSQGYQVDAIAPNGDRYCTARNLSQCRECLGRGREWILELMEDEDEFGLDPDFELDPDE